jgi:serine-type D-Ala-D-Ala carboxypeptidase/endopeptidase (penicillin-binding protein 4)
MLKTFLIYLFASLTISTFSQENSLNRFISDSVMIHASVSLYVEDAISGEPVMAYNSSKSLAPASVMKLITSAAALELLGPQYTFRTTVGYTGKLNRRSGKLKGNIVIKGGGDPALGSDYFSEHYKDFPDNWITEIKKTGIKKIEGRVITDDSYFDYQPVPSKWLWEDEGNYYGAGVYGLSVFDNTYDIHLKTSIDSSEAELKEMVPAENKFEFTNWLSSAGTSDEGYVFAAPYSTKGWLSGTIPANMDDYILKASITDPPRLMAKIVNAKIKAAGITVSGKPTTVRLEQKKITDEIVTIAETVSPALSEIIDTLNHESVNLYAETLVKELGKKYKNTGSTAAGVDVIKKFLDSAGIETDGMFIEDGSGLSPVNSINARGLADLLFYMKNKGKYFPEYYNSLPDAGKNGTLKMYFRDPVFDNRFKAKSGSMTRVRSYAGYFTTVSGKQMIFSIIVNNFTGQSKEIVSLIEELLKDIMTNK